MKNITKYWFLENFDLMKKMGKSNVMSICERLTPMKFTKGEELLFELDDKRIIFFLKIGTVKIVSGINNNTKSVIKSGNIFGELSIFNDNLEQRKIDKAIALTDGLVCFIDAEQMREFMDKYVDLKNNVLELKGFKIQRLERKLEDFLYKDSKTRIQEFVFNYISEHGVIKDGILETDNLISHSDVAQLTNSTRQTVHNVMSALRKDGIIDYDSKKIKIVNQLPKQ